MPELRSRVTTYLTDYTCDKCGAGQLLPTGKVVTEVEPPRYTHMCSNCLVEKEFEIQYPYLLREKTVMP
jgi:transcription elongation factor Elf1